MMRLFNVLPLFALAAVAAHAQKQSPINYARSYCIKVAPGKTGEFSSYVHHVAGRLMRARLEENQIAAGLLAEAVVPAGSSARCDYQAVYFYQGTLPEPFSQSETEAALKRADLKLTVDELNAKRDALGSLVSIEISRGITAVPTPMVNGEYIRLNYYKVKSGKMSAWIDLEKSGWKPLVAEYVKGGAVTGWFLEGILMPAGDHVRANAFTVDVFPDWASLMRGIPMSTLWPKVHPERSSNDYFDQLAAVSERPAVEVMRAVEIAAPKAMAASN